MRRSKPVSIRPSGADALQLMTVHSAKGLEFHSVFISGLEEGLFPHENSCMENGGQEEERRLMYVAITRARRRLYLSFAQSRMLHGQTRYNIASSFLRELPDELLHWITPRVAARNPAVSAAPSWAGGEKKAVPAWAVAADAGNETGWRIGQSVFHNKFGEGVVSTPKGAGRMRACK